jgi:hypothetical protein
MTRAVCRACSQLHRNDELLGNNNIKNIVSCFVLVRSRDGEVRPVDQTGDPVGLMTKEQV